MATVKWRFFLGAVFAFIAGGMLSVQTAYSSLPNSCDNSCSSRCFFDLKLLEQEIQNYRTQCGAPVPPPPGEFQVNLFHSDSCSSSLITSISPRSNCRKMSETISERVWGVQLVGTCFDSADTDFYSACIAFKAGPTSVRLYHSDSCSGGNLIGALSSLSNCEEFSTVNTSRVWGVSIEGKCFDVADTDSSSACTRFRGDQRSIRLFHNDSCSNNLVALIDPTTRCEDLRGADRAWAVEINGVCNDISDMDTEEACRRFSGNGYFDLNLTLEQMKPSKEEIILKQKSGELPF